MKLKVERYFFRKQWQKVQYHHRCLEFWRPHVSWQAHWGMGLDSAQFFILWAVKSCPQGLKEFAALSVLHSGKIPGVMKSAVKIDVGQIFLMVDVDQLHFYNGRCWPKNFTNICQARWKLLFLSGQCWAHCTFPWSKPTVEVNHCTFPGRLQAAIFITPNFPSKRTDKNTNLLHQTISKY